MGLMNWLRGPRAAAQSSGGGKAITSQSELEAAIRSMNHGTASGVSVTAESAMRVGAVFACVRIISGAVANLPMHIMRRVDDKTRENASDHTLWRVLRRKPNSWQTPSQFKRMMQAHILLRGNAYARIVWSRGSVIALIPMHPDRVEAKQANDLKLTYHYTRADGRKIVIASKDIMHLVGMTLDGVTGVSVITYAREAIGLSIAQDSHGAKTFKNSARPSSVLTHPSKLGKEGQENLRASLREYRAGGEAEGESLILEEGMKIDPMAMTSKDAEWIESRKFSRTDIAMFFGVPPHMIGDTEKSTSWGTGIEQQSIGFVTFTLEDHLTTWEETIERDLIVDEDDIYARFNRKALVRGDIKTRWEAHVKAMQWGVMSPNEVRTLEDENPRDGGDVYYDPPNTAGGKSAGTGENDEPS